jgi:hypothetical protein
VCADHHDAKRKNAEVVLVFELAIHRDKRIDLPCRAPEQLAVLDPSPTQSLDRCDVMIGQLGDQIVG